MPDQEQEEGWRQRREAEQAGQPGIGQDRPDQGRAGRHEQHRQAGLAPEERDPPGPDDVDDERLGGDGLDEPAGPELAVARVQDRTA